MDLAGEVGLVKIHDERVVRALSVPAPDWSHHLSGGWEEIHGTENRCFPLEGSLDCNIACCQACLPDVHDNRHFCFEGGYTIIDHDTERHNIDFWALIDIAPPNFSRLRFSYLTQPMQAQRVQRGIVLMEGLMMINYAGDGSFALKMKLAVVLLAILLIGFSSVHAAEDLVPDKFKFTCVLL